MEKDCLDCLYFTDPKRCPLYCKLDETTKEQYQNYVNEFNKLRYCSLWTDKSKKHIIEKPPPIVKKKSKAISLLYNKQLDREDRRLQITKKVRKKK